jgi:LacI family transcriptional regulator
MAPTLRIAVLVDTSTGWGRRVIRGILKFAKKHGPWDIWLEPQGQAEQMRLPNGWRGDGVIARVASGAMAAYLRDTGLPVVNVSAIRLRSQLFPTVTADTGALVQLALDHFRERGLHQFAYIGLANRSYSLERQQAFQDVCRRAGYDCHTYRPLPGANWQLRRESLGAWLTGLPKPIGVLTWGVQRGVELINEAKHCGFQIPDDVAILGGDDDELLCESVQPSLSGIVVPAEQIGHEAAGLLQGMLQRRRAKTPPRCQVPPLGISARASTDLLAIDDKDVVAAIRYIQSVPEIPLRICDVSKAVAVSQRSLERRFQKYVGRTIAEIISESHLARAKLLLASTDLSMFQVAQKSGFSSPEYMATVFRKAEGLSPRSYRTQAQGR